MIISNRVYDSLKWITLILLPAAGVLYLAVANTWGLSYGAEVVSTIAAIDLFLAAILGISTNQFNITNPMYRLNLVKLVDDSKETAWILSKNMYEFLTWTAQIFLPALIALYSAVSLVWPLPYPTEFAATVMALDAFLGALLGFSTAQYHKLAAIELIENSHSFLLIGPSKDTIKPE